MQKTKKSIRILISFVLFFSLILSPVLPAFADNGENLEGKTVILHTNDVHGAIDKYANIAGIRDSFEENGADVILADAGDFMQGSAYVSASKGETAVTLMNTVGYDIAAIGNHEFDYGWENLCDKMKEAQFPVVCSNVFTGSEALFESNYVFTTDDNLKIGFFGVDTPESQTKANPAMVKGLTFSQGEALYDIAKDQVRALDDADIIICLSHLGVNSVSSPNRSVDLYNNVPGIDFVIDGHSHTVMTEGENGEPIQSTGTKLANVGVIVIDNETKKIEDNYLLPITDDSPVDSGVKAFADGIIEENNKEYGEIFARSDVELNGARNPGNRTMETNLGDLITDAMLWAVLNENDSLGVPEENVVAVTNGGGIRDFIHKGDISKKDVNAVLPFGNTAVVVYVTGGQLLEALEASCFAIPGELGGFPQISGFSFDLNAYKEYDVKEETYPGSTYHGPASIQRVKITDVNSKRFNKNAVYAVVTNDFCAAGGDTYYAFADCETKFDTGLPLDEILMSYITEELDGVIDSRYSEPMGRITINTEAPTGLKAFIQKLSDWLDGVIDCLIGFFGNIKEFFSKTPATK